MATSTNAVVGILPSVIAGFGHAGKMHGRCIAKAQDRLGGCETADLVPTFVIDPALDGDLPDGQSEYRVIGSFDELSPDIRESAVAHICTPPGVRAEVIQRALEAGIRRFVVEKPLASAPNEMFRLADLRTMYKPELLVVSNWTASNLTREIQVVIEGRRSDVTGIEIRQRKCRISRTKANRSHGSAFEVEVPHMVSLAQMLAGPGLILRDARVWDMAVGNHVIPEMGGAELTLVRANGLTIEIRSDHLAPILERAVRVHFRDGARLEGYYPCSGLDHYSQLKGYNDNGEMVRHEYIEDDTLTQFFVEAYAYFLGRGACPLSDFEFNVKVCALLHEAQHLSSRYSRQRRA
jgi:predicted dehydrogenase